MQTGSGLTETLLSFVCSVLGCAAVCLPLELIVFDPCRRTIVAPQVVFLDATGGEKWAHFKDHIPEPQV